MENVFRVLKRIELNAFGTTDLSQPAIMHEVLLAMESDPAFTPDSSSGDERKRSPYNRDWVMEAAERGGPYCFENWFYFARRKAAKYSGYIITGKEPCIGLEFNPKMSPKNFAKLFVWADRVMQAFKPDYASLTFIYEHEIRPWPTELDKSVQGFLYSSVTVPGTYYGSGPAGVGLYTWIGRHFLDQIGGDFLMQTPHVTAEKQGWGGVRLSLGDTAEPWNLTPEEISSHWEPAMEHLWQKGIFAEQYVDEKGALRARKGQNSIIGGVIPDPPELQREWGEKHGSQNFMFITCAGGVELAKPAGPLFKPASIVHFINSEGEQTHTWNRQQQAWDDFDENGYL